MNTIRKLVKIIIDKNFRTMVLGRRGFYKTMPDDIYLKRVFKSSTGRTLDLENPKTYNEKLQWLKINERRPEFTMMVDKYKVRNYIKQVLGEEYLIPLLGVWDEPDAIDFNSLPDQFVLKCNHNSGRGMCICTNKKELDVRSVKKNLEKGLKEEYYYVGREWPYKDVPKKIIAEKYMIDPVTKDLRDYKFYCFNGKVKFVKHVDGNYHKAWLPKASEENEHADVMITTPQGVDVLCRQIAGAVARRIVTYAKDGEECYIDEHLGFIKLGSRVDVYLPVGTEICVKMGQSTTGDQTIIAKLK